MRLLNRLRGWRARRRPMPEPPLSLAYARHQEWLAAQAQEAGRHLAQARLQQEVAPAAGPDGWPGWCGLCCRPAFFALATPAPGGSPNLREQLACPGCGLNARSRAAMALLLQGLDPARAQVYLTEQASAAYVWLQAICPGLQGSEFGFDAAGRARLQAWYEQLGGRGRLVQRDVTRLDFADASLDAIGSYDVLEHVPDYPAALREFARCLRPGGKLVLTVPFLEASADTLVRARLLSCGQVEHLLPPEIHGDPVAGGVLCYYHFGWDLLEAARRAGFRDAHWLRTWSPREGLFALWTLVAIR